MEKDVVVLIGAGSIGIACARRIATGKHLIIGDINSKTAKKVEEDLYNAGFETSSVQVDLTSRESILNVVKEALKYGNIKNVINAAGVSPSQASIKKILEVDLYGTAVLLEEFGKVISEDGSCVVISSQSGHRLKALSQEENELLALTPTDELLNLEMLKENKIKDTLHAYQLAKRCNVLRVASEAIKWEKRNARVNSISPGIIITPLANDELNGPRGENYKKMLALAPAKRAGTPDEVGDLCEFLMSSRGKFITGADFLIDGGASASYWYGDLQYMKNTMGS